MNKFFICHVTYAQTERSNANNNTAEFRITKVFEPEKLFSDRILSVHLGTRRFACASSSLPLGQLRLKFMSRVHSNASFFGSKLINHLKGSPDDEWQVLYRKYIIIMMVSLFISLVCVCACELRDCVRVYFNVSCGISRILCVAKYFVMVSGVMRRLRVFYFNRSHSK